METDIYTPKPYPMTVVMATLGGPTLRRTIGQLNRGSVFPAEILICIPEQEAHRTADLFFPNVKVMVTQCRGQVPQRAIGFRDASYDIVMQLDDDIWVEEQCVAYLLETLEAHAPLVAVAPLLREKNNGNSVRMNSRFMKAYHFLMNGGDGYRMGGISKAGAEFGFDPLLLDKGVHDAEWVPGGCLLHFRDNLVKDNFFPFTGKAYCEDLLHSYWLSQKGVQLKIDARAVCSLDSNPISHSRLMDFIRTLSGDYRARKYFVKLSSRSLFRMHIFYLALMFNYLVKRSLVKHK